MIKFYVVVRVPGSVELDYSLEFEAPEVPQIGSYISVNRIGDRVVGEDMIVRHVWWRFEHPPASASNDEPTGNLIEIFVECDPAIGPYASRSWRKGLEDARARGIAVEDFQVSRQPIMGQPPEDDGDPI